MKPFSSVFCGAFLILSVKLGFAQGNQPVYWHFQWDLATNHEAILNLTANVAPGWHLYSQFLEQGGPMPTRLSFDRSDDYVLIGRTEEIGNPMKFRDDTYEMEIILYAAEVSFIQKIRLIQPVARVNGIVEYIACNDHTCVPHKQYFSMLISPMKKSP